MKKVKLIFSMIIVIAMMTTTSVVMVSCDDDDDAPGGLTVQSITASGTDLATGDPVADIDLFGATAASNVPLDATIEVVFNKEVDAATVTTTNVTVTGGDTPPTVNVSSSGAVVTITVSEELARGTDYTLTVSGLEATDGGILQNQSSITFKSAGRADVVPPHAENQVAYWRFDGDDTDAEDTYHANDRVAITYVADRFGQVESSASFNGTTSIIEVPEATSLLETNDFTLSFWVKPNAVDKTTGHFVVGLAGGAGFQFEIAGNYGSCKLAAQYRLDDETNAGQDLYWSTTGDLGWKGWTFDQDVSGSGGLASIMDEKWTHVVCTYNATTKVGSIYMNGELRKSQDFNLYGEEHPLFRAVGMAYAGTEPAHTGNLAFGFITDRASTAFDNEPWGNYESPDSNHLKGELDDVRIFHAAFSDDDVAQLYDDEKP